MAGLIDEPSIYVSGKFASMQKEEVWAAVLATGACGVNSKSAKSYLAADPDDPKLVATGKPIYTLSELPDSLDGWLERLKAAVAYRRAEQMRHYRDKSIAHLAYGPPADDALIAQIERAVGPLPAELVSLMRQFNGLSCVVSTFKSGKAIKLPDDTPLPYAALADTSHPLWLAPPDWLLGVIALPTWEDIFLRPLDQRLCYFSGYDPKTQLKIGSLKVKAEVLYPNLFAFDLYHHFGGVGLFLDPRDGQAKLIYAFDYWADLTSAQPISLRFYMESLVAGIWSRMSHAGQRPIKPTSKTAWPTYIRNIHGAPYVFVELK
jgi:hypothetical protein